MKFKIAIRTISAMLAAVLVSALLCGCNITESSKDDESRDRLKVVATIFPQYDFSKKIGGDLVDVEMLLTPGAESHYFEPSLANISSVNDSDVFIYVGGPNDDWVEDAFTSMDISDKQIVVLTDEVKLYEEEQVEGMEAEDEEEEGEDGIEYDEHVWTSLKNAQVVCTAICEAFCRADPDNAATYRANSEQYKAELAALDTSYAEMVAAAKRKTVVFAERFPFRYLAEDYGLKYYAAFAGCSSETEPTLATVSFLVNRIKSDKIPVVFYIEFSTEVTADKIIEETGVKKLLFHSCHNLSLEDFNAGKDYITLMKQNLVNLTEALN